MICLSNSQRQDTAVSVLTELSRAAGVAISSSFPAYAKVDGSQTRKSPVREEMARERGRERDSEARLFIVKASSPPVLHVIVSLSEA